MPSRSWASFWCAISTSVICTECLSHMDDKAPDRRQIRGRIEKILGWAKASKYRDGENPARWRDNLDQLLPKLAEVQKVNSTGAVLCHCRRSWKSCAKWEAPQRAHSNLRFDGRAHLEVILAGPAEINKRDKLWTAPAEHVKLKRSTRCRSVAAPCGSSMAQWKLFVSEPVPSGKASEQRRRCSWFWNGWATVTDRARLPVDL